MKKRKIALFIGRFQPFHIGHFSVIQELDNDNKIKEILIGIVGPKEKNKKNPYSFSDRVKIINEAVKKSIKKSYRIFVIPDINNDKKWVDYVTEKVGLINEVYTGNEWVERLFKEKKIKVKPVNIKYHISGTLIRQINELKKKKNAVILVHNYQRPEIYEVADYIGDSLELAGAAAKTKAKIIVFCGVDFMAESAKILNPAKKVLLPALDARCPMAGMVDIAKLKEMQIKYPKTATVSYINTTAETKAYSDICVTSANAVKVVKSLSNKEIIFLPDKNLALYVQSQVPNKKIIPWEGYCYVHSRILAAQVKQAIKLHKKSMVLVHPECPPEVIKLADKVCSTSQMIYEAQKSRNKEFIIVTEGGMVNRLRKEAPDKIFYSIGGFCLQMKKNYLEKVYDCLKHEKNIIKVPEKIRIKAKKTLDKMLKIK
jgi:quinolinate synthase